MKILFLLGLVFVSVTGFADDDANPKTKRAPLQQDERVLPFLDKSSGPAEWIAAIVSIVALVGVAVEYRRSKGQERLQRAQEMIDQLSSNETLLFACTVLDWGTGILVVPGPWREVIGEPSIHWNLADIRDALHTGLTAETANSPQRLLYRHAFVQLFNHFERIGDLERKGAIHDGDLRPIAWVAHNLKWWQYGRGCEDRIFLPAMDAWYPNKLPGQLVEQLARKYPGEAPRAARPQPESA